MARKKFSTGDQGSRFQELKRLWLESVIEASGRTQADIATVMEISPANLSALVNSHKAITDDMMDRVATALNLMLPDLGIKAELPAPPHAKQNSATEAEIAEDLKAVKHLLNALLDRVPPKP